jgi:hypothetical protein
MEPKSKVKCEACGKECVNLGAHLRFCKGVKADSVEDIKKTSDSGEQSVQSLPKKNVIVLINTSGKEVPQEDYFFKGVVPPGFLGTCGKPVDREDLLTVFNKVFKPSDNFLFYKPMDKEVYIIIPPIRYSTTIGESNNSLEGDFQKHAISFINEGSVNLDTLRMKLDRILKFCKFDDR